MLDVAMGRGQLTILNEYSDLFQNILMKHNRRFYNVIGFMSSPIHLQAQLVHLLQVPFLWH